MIRISDGEWLIELKKDSHPNEIMVELTTACNYNCVFCFRRATDEPLNGFMSVRTFERLLEQAVSAGVEKLSFTGWGETLVHPKALDFIKAAKSKGLKVLVATNGALLERYVDDLVSLGVDELYVSVDSVRKEVYNMLRVGGRLSNVSRGLVKLRERKVSEGSRRPDLTLQMTLNTYNALDLDDLPTYAIEVGATKVIISLMLPLTEEMEKSLACYLSEPCLSRLRKFRDKIDQLAPYITIILPNTSTVSERRCPFISRGALYVRWDGKVAPCIYYAHSWSHVFDGIRREIKSVTFGNINEKDLMEIWRDPSYVSFRARVYFFRMPSCLDCPVRRYCLLTLSNESDCWGNSPTCAACPFSHDMVRCPL